MTDLVNNLFSDNDLNVFFPIKGYEGLYEINKKGEVKSLFRKNPHRYNTSTSEKIISKRIIMGYYCVCLSKNGVAKYKKLHRLLAETFIPNSENKEQVNHIDGNKINNDINNLEWATRQENSFHAYKLGLNHSGENNCKSKLTADKVLAIRRLFRINPKSNRKKIASKLNISIHTISDILCNRSWNYI